MMVSVASFLVFGILAVFVAANVSTVKPLRVCFISIVSVEDDCLCV
jgi:hypothetical protein